jgi:hypothetical protein
MPDLDAAIRERLELVETNRDLWMAIAPFEADVRVLLAALAAVLDEHVHIGPEGALFPGARRLEDPDYDCDEDPYSMFSVVATPPAANKGIGCTRCHYYTHGAVRGYGWCATVRAIAAALGVEVTDA